MSVHAEKYFKTKDLKEAVKALGEEHQASLGTSVCARIWRSARAPHECSAGAERDELVRLLRRVDTRPAGLAGLA